VIDWDAALLIDQPQNFDETLYVMELANLQLAELEAYDRLLDNSLERAYRDLSARPIRGRTSILQELREIRIDLARFSDELSNITKLQQPSTREVPSTKIQSTEKLQVPNSMGRMSRWRVGLELGI